MVRVHLLHALAVRAAPDVVTNSIRACDGSGESQKPDVGKTVVCSSEVYKMNEEGDGCLAEIKKKQTEILMSHGLTEQFKEVQQEISLATLRRS